MRRPWLHRAAAALAALAVAGALGWAAWLWSLPSATSTAAAAQAVPPVPRAERDALLQSLKPAKRTRPLVAVLGLNDATETTDYLVPTGILRRANVADVMLLATGPGQVRLYPALQVMPDATTLAFDAAHPDGADYVIVPAMSRDDDPAVLRWLGSQAAKGARIIGICAGAKVVAAAGLLDGKRATTHWYYLRDLLARHPAIEHVSDRRMVSDEGVTTTTGITASMPLMLALVEAIAGPTKSQALEAELGHAPWDARHASGAFRLTREFATTVIANRMTLRGAEELGIALEPGMDEAALALVADAWSRTYRSHATTFAASAAAVKSRHGIRVIPDQAATYWPESQRIALLAAQKPVDALDDALAAIGTRFGARTADVVAMQLEYPR